MEEQLSAAGGEIAAEIRNGVATVTLNRPAALNALTLGMVEGLSRWLDAWERDPRVRIVALRGAGDKAFCAGGDIRALHDSVKQGTPYASEFYRTEYALDYRIHTYPKTIVAVMDGIVMGGGMGISQGASVRIVGARTRMAMPETAIGAFPDVGASYFLSRLPGRLGIYLGLVGPTLDAADAIYCGLADLHGSAGILPAGELEPIRPAIDEHFSRDSIAAIIDSLRGEKRPHYEGWAARTLDTLSKKSPTMLAVTLEQLRRGREMSLADCFRMELNLIHGAIEHGDYIEGIRALIVDKDKNPRWRPEKSAQTASSAVDAFFKPRWEPAQHPLATLR